MTKNPIIVALDVESAEEARALVRSLGPHVTFYKVGMELYASAGIAFVRELVDQGLDVFLDLKFYDIPETVRRAVAQVATMGVALSHHSRRPVRDAGGGRGQGRVGAEAVCVTVLTSFGPEDLADLGYTCPASELVATRARQARAARVDGIVCSPLRLRRCGRSRVPRRCSSLPGCGRPGARRATRSASPHPPRRSETAPIIWSSDARSRAPPTRSPRHPACLKKSRLHGRRDPHRDLGMAL